MPEPVITQPFGNGRSRLEIVEGLARDDVATPKGSPRTRSAKEIEALTLDIGSAVDRDELVLHYQPIVDIRTGKCRRVEALLRWRHPRYGLILPGELLPLAERLGLAESLGNWVLEAAMRQFTAWRGRGLKMSIGINLSSSELASPEIVRALRHQLATHGPEAITLEVDSKAMARGDLSKPTLFQLFAAGARIALDDVTAETAPARLLASGIDEVKLSRRLVRTATGNAASETELGELIQFARDSHLAVTAVGVEDKATRDLVVALGCDFAQGYWISRPLVPDRIAPVRRFAAAVAFGGALAFATEIGSGMVSGAVPIGMSAAANASPQSANATVSRLEDLTGLAFVEQPATRTALLIDARIEPTRRRQLAAAVDRDVAQLEQDFGHGFERLPTLYFFATRSSFALGLQEVFGARGPDAGALAAASGGVAIPREGAIVVNLQNADTKDAAIVRHELTHILVRQIAGTNAALPAWFDEGLATLEQQSVTATAQGARDRVVSLALLDTRKTSLAELDSPELFRQHSAAINGQGYQVAAEAVRLLKERVSPLGVMRILESTGRGVPFADAFSQETNESVAAFEAAFGSRLTAESPSIAVTPTAGGVVWTLSGFPPESPLTINIAGSSYDLEYSATTDSDGIYRAAFGSNAPSGTYAIHVTGASRSAEGRVRVGGSAPLPLEKVDGQSGGSLQYEHQQRLLRSPR